MTSSDREQLVWFLVEAELEEGRVSDFFAKMGDRAQRGVDAVGRGAGRVGSAAKDAGSKIVGYVPDPGHVAWLGRKAGARIQGAGETALGGLRTAGGATRNFVIAGAKGGGIAPEARRMLALRNAYKNPAGRAMILSTGKRLGGAVGRSAAVYGGAAALTAGGALGARALYRRHKARKARKEQE